MPAPQNQPQQHQNQQQRSRNWRPPKAIYKLFLRKLAENATQITMEATLQIDGQPCRGKTIGFFIDNHPYAAGVNDTTDDKGVVVKAINIPKDVPSFKIKAEALVEGGPSREVDVKIDSYKPKKEKKEKSKPALTFDMIVPLYPDEHGIFMVIVTARKDGKPDDREFSVRTSIPVEVYDRNGDSVDLDNLRTGKDGMVKLYFTFSADKPQVSVWFTTKNDGQTHPCKLLVR